MSDAPARTVSHAGRQLNVWVSGPDRGGTLVFHPGTPFPPVDWPALEASAAAHDLRLISHARPGYSGSTRHPDRSVADVAQDTAAILDALAVDDFVVIGHSGGGPHALACAALLPGRCRAAVSLAGVAPYDAAGLDWLTGMADENIEEFTMVLAGKSRLRQYLAAELEKYSVVTADEVAAALGGLVSDTDRAATTGDLADMTARSLRRAASDGLDGWVDDDLAFVGAWGFELEDISVPVGVWQGREDRMVPFSHGEWLQAHIPTARSRLFDDEGHISLLTNRLGDVVGDVVALAQA